MTPLVEIRLACLNKVLYWKDRVWLVRIWDVQIRLNQHREAEELFVNWSSFQSSGEGTICVEKRFHVIVWKLRFILPHDIRPNEKHFTINLSFLSSLKNTRIKRTRFIGWLVSGKQVPTSEIIFYLSSIKV